MITATTPHIENLDNFLQHCRLREYERGQTIIHAGDVPTTLYYILEGSVAVLLEQDEDKEVVVAYLNRGDFFGEMGLFDGQPVRSAWCRARQPCEIAEIQYDKFRLYIHEHSDVLFTIGRQLTHRLRNTTRKVGDLAFYDVTGRIARTLIALSKEPDAVTHPDGMQIRITRQELGRLVNCSREVAGRVLKTLEEQQLIAIDGRSVVVYGTR